MNIFLFKSLIGKNLVGFEQKLCFGVPKGKTILLGKLNEGLLLAVNDGTFKRRIETIKPCLAICCTTDRKHNFGIRILIFIMSGREEL